MANTPVVSVGRPDDLGLRKVTIDDHPIGEARSYRELQRLLRRDGPKFGLDLPVCRHDIHWIGGGCDVWPDRPWRRRSYGILMAVLFLGTAFMLIRFGVKDTFSALSYAGRITGVTFVLVAVTEVIAAAVNLDYWRKRRLSFSGTILLVGASISLVVSLVLLFAQMVTGWTYQNYLPIWAFFVMLSIWALVTLVRDKAWKGLRNPRTVAVGAVVTGVLAITNVTYSQIYVPYATSPVVESSAEFGKPTLDEARATMYLPVHLSMKNSGQIPVYVLGSIYWIHGLPEGGKRFALIHADEFIKPPGRPLNPGEEFSEDEVVEIGTNGKPGYETIKVQTELYAIRKDRMTIVGDYERSGKDLKSLKKEGKENDPNGPKENYFRYQADISNSNEVLNVTRGRQRVTLWYVNKKLYPYLIAEVAPPGARVGFDLDNPNANKKANERYGLAKVRGSMAQKPFGELMEMAQEQPTVGASPQPAQ
ncbi:hypothetical protein [Streptomyces sp. NPDC097981]|uniref:hypothetical protein n=1 Tax=Streptomyces sp. NPDC097981 TaxID=3155428 RepID=UPI00331E9B4A